MRKTNTIRFIDLFAGIGGFRLGLENANKYGLEKSILQPEGSSKTRRDSANSKGSEGNRKSPYRCVWSNEWDKYAADIYDKNFGGKIDRRDIRTVKSSEIPDFDLLVGGFPCQAFSIAGKRKGFDDTRGTLFFEIARILADKRPRYFILENVKGLLSHNEGKTFQTILGVLSDLGYEYQWQVLNSKNFGVPQNRERVFIIGNLGETSRPKVFPIIPNSEPDIVLPTLTARYWGGQANGGYIGNKEVKRQPLKFLNRNQRNYQGDYAFTVDGANTGGIKQDMKIRRLTPTECERLQGFPDGWTEIGLRMESIFPISDTQRYKCLGNAVTTNVVSYLGSLLTK